MRTYSWIYLTFFTFAASAQLIPESEFLRRMDKGEALMKSGEYEAAQLEFLFILNNKEVIPANLAYFFGRNSYHLKEYKQSINWLNKYIQLRGTKGGYYAEAVRFLQLAEKEFLELNKVNADTASSFSIDSDDFDCGGLEKMICPVCKGSGVVVKKNHFGKSYQSCAYSKGEGYMSCTDYNLFMRGKLQIDL